MSVARFIVVLILLLLSTGCNKHPEDVEADDFGFPKKYISAKGKNVQGVREDQYAQWEGTGLRMADTDTLYITIRNRWASWFDGEKSIMGNADCKYMYPSDLGKGDPNDPSIIAIYNPPCWMKNGVGLYMLVTPPSQPHFNPNSTPEEIRSPSAPTYHLAPYMPGAGGTPSGGWNAPHAAGMQPNGNIYLKILDRYYEDNGKGYTVVFKGGVSFQKDGPIESTIHLVTNTFANAAKEIFNNAVRDSRFISAIRAILNLYILFTAVAYMFGLMDISQGELVIRIFKFGIVLALISDNSWDFFNNYLFSIFIGTDGNPSGVEEVIGIVLRVLTHGDAQDGLRIFDSMWHSFTSEETTAKIWSLLFSQPEGFLFIPLLYGAMFLFLVAIARAVCYYLLSIIAVSMLIILAPIFLTCILFSLTKPLYTEWLKQLMSYALQPIILFCALSVFGMIIMTQLYKTLGYPVSWAPYIHIPYFNMDFNFWMPRIHLDNTERMLLPPLYETVGERYPDLPFLDPANSDDAARIERIKKSGDSINFLDIFLFYVVIYCMMRFNNMVPALARGLSGTANGMASLERPTAMMMKNALESPGRMGAFLARTASHQYDSRYGEGSADRMVNRISNQYLGGSSLNSFNPMNKVNEFRDGVGTRIENASDAISATINPLHSFNKGYEAAQKRAADAFNNVQDGNARAYKATSETLGQMSSLDSRERAQGMAKAGAFWGRVMGAAHSNGGDAPIAAGGISDRGGVTALARDGNTPVQSVVTLPAPSAGTMETLEQKMATSQRDASILQMQSAMLARKRESEERAAIKAMTENAKGNQNATAAVQADVKAAEAVMALNHKIANEPDPEKRKQLENERAAHLQQINSPALKQELASIDRKYTPGQLAVAEKLAVENAKLEEIQRTKAQGAEALVHSQNEQDRQTMQALLEKSDKDVVQAVARQKTEEEAVIKEALSATKEREAAANHQRACEEAGVSDEAKQQAKERVDAAILQESAAHGKLTALTKEDKDYTPEEMQKMLEQATKDKTLAENHEKAVLEREALVKAGGTGELMHMADDKCRQAAEAQLGESYNQTSNVTDSTLEQKPAAVSPPERIDAEDPSKQEKLEQLLEARKEAVEQANEAKELMNAVTGESSHNDASGDSTIEREPKGNREAEIIQGGTGDSNRTNMDSSPHISDNVSKETIEANTLDQQQAAMQALGEGVVEQQKPASTSSLEQKDNEAEGPSKQEKLEQLLEARKEAVEQANEAKELMNAVTGESSHNDASGDSTIEREPKGNREAEIIQGGTGDSNRTNMDSSPHISDNVSKETIEANTLDQQQAAMQALGEAEQNPSPLSSIEAEHRGDEVGNTPKSSDDPTPQEPVADVKKPENNVSPFDTEADKPEKTKYEQLQELAAQQDAALEKAESAQKLADAVSNYDADAVTHADSQGADTMVGGEIFKDTVEGGLNTLEGGTAASLERSNDNSSEGEDRTSPYISDNTGSDTLAVTDNTFVDDQLNALQPAPDVIESSISVESSTPPDVNIISDSADALQHQDERHYKEPDKEPEPEKKETVEIDLNQPDDKPQRDDREVLAEKIEQAKEMVEKAENMQRTVEMVQEILNQTPEDRREERHDEPLVEGASHESAKTKMPPTIDENKPVKNNRNTVESFTNKMHPPPGNNSENT